MTFMQTDNNIKVNVTKKYYLKDLVEKKNIKIGSNIND